MPFNPVTGVFTRTTNSFSQPVFGTEIDPTDADALFDDYDAGLSEAAASLFGILRTVTAAGSVTVSNTEPGVLINKTVGAPTAVSIPAAGDRTGGTIVVKDLKQDASTNNITITPASGTIDGNATWTIVSDGGWVRLYPLASGTGYWVGP
jgi:hypothetical protein